MKRSEMLDSIEDLLRSYHPVDDYKEMARIMLDHVESDGMMPPFNKQLYYKVWRDAGNPYEWTSENEEESLEQWKDNSNKGYIKDE